MSSIKFYTADTESNGLSVKLHNLFEISMIREDRTQITCHIRIDNPENSSMDALKITGKTVADLRKGSNKFEAINEIETFINEDGLTPSHRCLVGHNIINFDRKFLCALWEKCGKRFPFDLYLDTISMYKDYCKKQGIVKPKVNLTAACEQMKIKKRGEAHSALIDTRHTYLLWQEISKTVDFMDHIKCLPHNIEL